ncbi:MAG: hypothetical protein DRI71_07900, partial [Bacteroidetes bacterium]
MKNRFFINGLIKTTILMVFIFISKNSFSQEYPIETVIQAGHSTIPWQACISKNGKYLLSASSRKVILWDIKSGKQIRVFKPESSKVIVNCRFYNNDKYVQIALKQYWSGKTTTYYIFDISTGKFIEKKEYKKEYKFYINKERYYLTDNEIGELYLPALHKTNKKIVRKQTFVLSLVSGKDYDITVHQQFKGHSDLLRSWEISRDNKRLLSGGEDSSAIYWNVETGTIIHRLVAHNGPITNVNFSPDEKFAITSSMDGSIIIWDLSDGSIKRRFVSNISQIGSVDYNSKNKSILVASNNAFIWDLGKLTVINEMNLNADVLADTNLRLICKNTAPLNSNFYKILRGESNVSYGWKEFFDSKFSPDNNLIATGSFSNKLNIWDSKMGAKIKTIQLSKKMIYSIDFSPDNRYIAAGLYDNELAVYDLISDSLVVRIPNGRTHIYSVCYSPDGKKIAYVSDGSTWARLLDTETNTRLKSINFEYADLLFVSFSNNNEYLVVSGADPYLQIYSFKEDSIYKFPTKHKSQIRCVKFSLDDQFIFTASDDNTIMQWDFNKKEVIQVFKGHKGNVNTIAFIEEKNYLISGSQDGTAKIWDIKTGEIILTLVAINKNEYFAFSPDNYYTSSKSSVDKLHFVQGMKIYGFEQFDLKFNRPDIILSRLGFADLALIEAYHKAYLKRLNKMNFTEDMLKDDFHLPEIKIQNFEEMPTITDSNYLSLNLQLNDNKYKLDRINVWVNDVAVYGTNGISLRDKGVSSYQANLKVNLVKGKNKVQVSVLNQAGAESYKETFEIECSAGKSKPDLYLITIGESKFKDSKFNLTYAAKDAQDVALLFAKSKNHEKVITKTLTNEQVTKENITALRSFLDQADINDEVMIFIAGHGVLDENLDYFFASYDMDFNNPSQRGIAYEDLEGLLDGIKPLKKVLLIDACHSGEIDKEEVELLAVNEEVGAEGIQFRAIGNTVKPKLGMQNTSELTKALFTDLRKGTGATVISSAGGGEYAMESGEWKNGLFTYCLLKGIETGEADLNKDG